MGNCKKEEKKETDKILGCYKLNFCIYVGICVVGIILLIILLPFNSCQSLGLECKSFWNSFLISLGTGFISSSVFAYLIEMANNKRELKEDEKARNEAVFKIVDSVKTLLLEFVYYSFKSGCSLCKKDDLNGILNRCFNFWKTEEVQTKDYQRFYRLIGQGINWAEENFPKYVEELKLGKASYISRKILNEEDFIAMDSFKRLIATIKGASNEKELSEHFGSFRGEIQKSRLTKDILNIKVSLDPSGKNFLIDGISFNDLVPYFGI